MKCNRKTLLLQFPCKKKKRSWREHYTHAYTYVWVGCQKVQEGNFGRRKFFSHLILEEGVASKRALRSISFIFIIILKIHLTNTFEKSSHIYTNSTRRLYMINTMTSKIKFLTLVAVSVLFHKPVNNEIFPVHFRLYIFFLKHFFLSFFETHLKLMRTDRLHLIGERSRAFLFPRAQFLLHLETHNERILFVFFRGGRTRTLSFFFLS